MRSFEFSPSADLSTYPHNIPSFDERSMNCSRGRFGLMRWSMYNAWCVCVGESPVQQQLKGAYLHSIDHASLSRFRNEAAFALFIEVGLEGERKSYRRS